MTKKNNDAPALDYLVTIADKLEVINPGFPKAVFVEQLENELHEVPQGSRNVHIAKSIQAILTISDEEAITLYEQVLGSILPEGNTTYVMLLRGINVGGKNKLSMAELKVALEESGFQNVVTYINSGNLIFDYQETDSLIDLAESLKQLIAFKFKLDIPVLVRAIDYISAFIEKPTWWGIETEVKHNAIFVMPPATVEGIIKEVGAIKPDYEQIASFGNVIFWSAPLATFSRSRWSQVVGKASYGKITIRNANTFNRLANLLLKQ